VQGRWWSHYCASGKNLNEIGKCGGIPLVVNEENVDQLEEIINHEIQNCR
jgi:hypothetical protein